MTPQLIETVLGPVPSDRLGIVLPHEHLPSYRGPAPEQEIFEPPDGYRLRAEEWQREAIREAQGFGVGTLVEVTPIGCNRPVPMMQRLSRETGVHIVASTGFYLEDRMPPWVKDRSEGELADLMARDLTEGIAPHGVRPWMIKVAGGAPLKDLEKKVCRAAALASRRTGAAITTHSCGGVREHFDFLVEAGADPARLYIGHADFGKDNSEHLHVARSGGHLIFTCWGIQHFVDQDVLAGRVAELACAGFAAAVLISTDYALVYSSNRMDLISMEYECPMRTHAFVLRHALPKLREKGLSEDLLRRFTVENPRTMLERPSAPARSAPSEPRGARPIEVRSGMDFKLLSDGNEQDALRIANAFIAGWPYSRPVGGELIRHWRTLPKYQPEHMWVGYRDGRPCTFLHGEFRDQETAVAHLLATLPGAVDEACWLLGQFEDAARRAGLKRLVGPHYASGAFYGGYVLGLEPYHPHWSLDGTQAFVRSGFRISNPAIMLVRGLAHQVRVEEPPAGYEFAKALPPEEFEAKTFGWQALFRGQRVAICLARLYPRLKAPGGGPVGQLGQVTTDEPHRGKGLARIMTQMCARDLQAMGASEALIATSLENAPALRAYERAGFRRQHHLIEWSKAL